MNLLKIIFLFFCTWMTGELTAQTPFERYFLDKTLRFDYYHCGDSRNQEYFFDELKEEPYWAGSKVSLLDDTGYGVQLFKIFDKASGKEIYSRSYCTLFNEWQTTPEAQTVRKAMPESVVFPYPKNEVRIEIYARNRKGVFEKKEFFSYSPFKENAARFNIRAVWAPSMESGVTIPGEHVWRNTAAQARYYTFDSERYHMIEDFQGLRDIAAHVPYDHIYVLSNTQKYGGGGIYNFYGISAAHHPNRTGKIYVHEFGHVLLGLGDEYIGNVSYNDMYPTDVEPWEANLTTLTDFGRKEWKKMLDTKTPVPTPVNEKTPQKLGVYEGGGYVNKGVYRPWPNCLMNNLHTIDIFCPVCSQAIRKQIDFLCR